jgi:hypothetical protein
MGQFFVFPSVLVVRSVPTVTFLVVTPMQCCSRKSRTYKKKCSTADTLEMSCCLGRQERSNRVGACLGYAS